MATEGTRDSWYWPKITNIADAAKASDQGFWAAVLVAGITTVIATITVFAGREIAAINPYAYIDAALFALIAWRIRRRSRAFAVVGLVLFLFEKIHQFSVEPQVASVGAIMAIFRASFYQRPSRYLCVSPSGTKEFRLHAAAGCVAVT